MADDVRILLLADSHLGFDLPVRPRVARRRRGHDFLANYLRALEPAVAGEVDLVVHAGDVFNRSKPAASVAFQALEPLRRIAERGVPVFIVPGNHERSRIPHVRFAQHSNVHVFDEPRTFVVDVRGRRVALAGFPFARDNVRAHFSDLVGRTGWSRGRDALRLLCIHHCVEGATVGPGNYTFTTAEDVVRLRDVPTPFAVVLSGHIHRHQAITADLLGRPIAVPVLYPGSVERTTLAEIGERKGFMIVHVGDTVRWEFRELPARPMFREDIHVDGTTAASFAARVAEIIAAAPLDAVLSIRIVGTATPSHLSAVTARLRALTPATMNVDIQMPQRFAERVRAPAGAYASRETAQLTLYESV
jgi:DNA repair exonuclease SbcCD nuclease subunit